MLNEGVRRAGKYPSAMIQSIENIHQAITIGAPLLSTGESALLTQKICEKIVQKVVT